MELLEKWAKRIIVDFGSIWNNTSVFPIYRIKLKHEILGAFSDVLRSK